MTDLLPQTSRIDDWRSAAACRGADPALFFPVRGEPVAPARAVCGSCPVADPCLHDALERGERWGVWGGQTELERRRTNAERAARS